MGVHFSSPEKEDTS